jgi:hypothetical protein
MPTNCYDKYGITPDDINNQVGSEEPIPEDAVKIIHADNKTVTLGKACLCPILGSTP